MVESSLKQKIEKKNANMKRTASCWLFHFCHVWIIEHGARMSIENSIVPVDRDDDDMVYQYNE